MNDYKLLLAFFMCLFLLSEIAVGQSPAMLDPQPAGQTSVPADQSSVEPISAALSMTHANTLASCFNWVSQHNACAITFGAISLFIVLATAALLIAAGRPSAKPYITTLNASFFFWLGIGYLLLLLVIAAFYIAIVPAKHPPLFLGDVLPIAVPWFGALGAVLISLEGIFAYGQRDWDPKFNYWHIGRPLFGAVLGIVAFFTYVLIVISSGSVPAFLDGKEPSSVPKDYIVYYIVAFLVGYREETFRELIRRVTDLILKPGSAAADAPTVTFRKNGAVIANLDFGLVTAAASRTVSIDVENTGKGSLKSPSVFLDKSTAAEFTTANNKLAGITELRPGEMKSVDITFSPTAVGTTYAGVLTVIGNNLSTPAKLAMTGKG